MLRKWFIVVLLVFLAKSGNGGGHYTIIAPESIRANSEYHVSASLHDATEPSTIRLTVKNKGGFSDSKEVTVQPYTTEMVRFSTRDLHRGTYSIVAEGISGIRFFNESRITFHWKSQIVLIQTDKAMYKPGDKVNFRVLVLDANLKPNAIRGDMRVFITDSYDNRIKQWLNATTTKSVFTGELQLSDFPNLGDWYINVEVNGETKMKSFEIAEYVPPKYEVTVDTDKDITFRHGQVRVTVRAKYAYGKPVKGQAIVTVIPISSKTIIIDGKGYVEFDIKNDLGLESEYGVDFVIDATVTEDLTGITQVGKAFVSIHRHEYTITIADKYDFFKPGLPLVFTAQVAYHDGSPVMDAVNKVKITGSFERPNSTFEEEYTLDSNGMIYVKYATPEDISRVINFEAQYLEQRVDLGAYWTKSFRSGQNIKARVLTPNPRFDRNVSIEITSTEPLDYFTYQILGRGDIIVTRTELVPKAHYYVFNFLASFAMVPKAELIVYYLDDGEIISDKIDIEFGGQFNNFVRVNMPAAQIRPGKNIDITISTKPGSLVGLLGVDRSVILMKDGNDLSKSKVLNELDEYNREGYRYADYLGWQDFNNVVLLTNAIEPLRISRTRVTSVYSSSAFYPRKRQERQTIRTEFPETFIWDMVNVADSTGTTTIQKRVPDTITSWVITGFTMNDVYGLGLTKSPSTLKVFQPFFVSLNLPYSIKQGETVAIQSVVFNYMDQPVSASVTLDNSEQEFIYSDPTNEVIPTSKIERERQKSVIVNSNEGVSVSFLITPKKVGPIKIKVTAISPLAGDAIEKTLLVVPEGMPEHKTKTLFIDLRAESEFNDTFTIEIPETAVPDSTQITVSVVGDIMGSAIKNFDQLIRKPKGSGEKNMLNFVPCIVAINYLRNTGQLTRSIERKALKFMEIGYQRELTYKHYDGSFSTFGKSDNSGSTWLTAFVVRSFIQARNHIMIADNIITDALDWLQKRQDPDGSFPEVGHVIHKDMQGGSSKGVALTAFVVTAFLEDPTKIDIYSYAIDRGLQYIVRNLEGVNDTYSLAVASYVTQLARDQSRTILFQKLDASAKTTGDTKHWEKAVPQSNSVNVEVTAYALLTLVNNNQIAEGLPIMKWLLSQQNENGGFQSTQDTVVGITALAKYAEKISSDKNNAVISVSYLNGSESAIRINSENALLMQTLEIPPDVRSINLKGTGSGFALCQLAYKYNLNAIASGPRFLLDPQVVANSSSDYLHLTVCTTFVPSGDETESNMAVMEVSYPSGVVADLDRIPSLESSKGVKKVETKNGDTMIVLYIDKLGSEELCFAIDGYRTSKVADQMPSPVTIYDYYDPSKKTTVFYQSLKNDLCDICDDAACKDACMSVSKVVSFLDNEVSNSTS